MDEPEDPTGQTRPEDLRRPAMPHGGSEVLDERLVEVGVGWVVLAALFPAPDQPQGALVEHWNMNASLASVQIEAVTRLPDRDAHRQQAHCPVPKSEADGCGVLDFAQEKGIADKAADFCHRTQEVHQHLDAVAAEIHQWSAPGPVLSQEP